MKSIACGFTTRMLIEYRETMDVLHGLLLISFAMERKHEVTYPI